MSLFNAIDTTRWIESVYGEYIYIGGEILQSFDNTAIIVERKIKKKKKPSSSPIYFPIHPIPYLPYIPPEREEIFLLQFSKKILQFQFHLSKEQRTSKITRLTGTLSRWMGQPVRIILALDE